MASAIDTAIAAYRAAWQAEIDRLLDGDDLKKTESELYLERYACALSSKADFEAGKIQSYTIAGRTFSYKNAREATGEINNLRTDLINCVYGNTTLVNMNINRLRETVGV